MEVAFELRKLWALKGREYFKDATIEIGCGNGAFSGVLFETIDDGIDINSRVIERCKKKRNGYRHLHCMDAHLMNYPDGRYRTVFAKCVIEHPPDIDGVLEESYLIRRENGIIIAMVPLQDMNNHLLFKGKG